MTRHYSAERKAAHRASENKRRVLTEGRKAERTRKRFERGL